MMRYAIYYAPAFGALLHQLGASWLGRDCFTGGPVKQPAIEGLREVTAEPCRYGFHATLKPPFTLREGVSRIDFGDAVAAFADQLHAIPGCRLEPRLIDGFLALVPVSPDARLSALADSCVRELDQFRESASSEELDRRRAAGLSPRQEKYLVEWGYPCVFEEFRFHMTLTRRLDKAEAAKFLPAAQAHFEPALRLPIMIDAITIFREARPGADFMDEERFNLTRAAERAAS